MKCTWTNDDLILAVENNLSIAGVCRDLGLVPRGGNYHTINRRIGVLGLDIEHMTGQGWNVGLGFQPSPPRSLKEILKSNSPFSSSHLRDRLIKEGVKEYRCESCGLTEWLDEPIPLELEHKDGDHDNNRIENLSVLCPNCHAKTPTYRRRKTKGV
jgi:Zn finger protein HypA/HybF involved in hydrogenase expression